LRRRKISEVKRAEEAKQRLEQKKEKSKQQTSYLQEGRIIRPRIPSTGEKYFET